MSSIKTTTKVVQAIFSLHVATAGLALILLLATFLLFLRQLNGGSARPSFMRKTLRTREGKKHSSLGPHLCLMSGLFNLMVAYATQAAIVALRTKINSPADITAAYSYGSHLTNPVFSSGTPQGKYISILSFLYQAASIMVELSIIAAIWLHANHMEENGTGLKCPGFISWVWNLFWLTAVAGLGFGSWAWAISRRGIKREAVSYPYRVDTDYYTKTIYVTYIAVVVAASTSATIEAFLCWTGTKKNGLITQTHAKRALALFVFLVVPIVWARNAFSITQVVLLYKDYSSWSQATNQALAFLFIIFGELAQLAILTLVLYGAWSYSKTIEQPVVVHKEARDSASYYTRSGAPTVVV